METSLLLHTYEWENDQVSYYAPDLNFVEEKYRSKNLQEAMEPFPYWVKVWPAALGLCNFIIEHPHFIYQKQILELAGGLGLPSLVATRYAKQVCFSDYSPEAVEVVKRSVSFNGFKNIDCKVLDWHHLSLVPYTEVLLLSDVNYEPSEFDTIIKVIESFLQKGTIIILSTPQRLMAIPFIEKIIPWCQNRKEISVLYKEQNVAISVFILAVMPLDEF